MALEEVRRWHWRSMSLQLAPVFWAFFFVLNHWEHGALVFAIGAIDTRHHHRHHHHSNHNHDMSPTLLPKLRGRPQHVTEAQHERVFEWPSGPQGVGENGPRNQVPSRDELNSSFLHDRKKRGADGDSEGELVGADGFPPPALLSDDERAELRTVQRQGEQEALGGDLPMQDAFETTHTHTHDCSNDETPTESRAHMAGNPEDGDGVLAMVPSKLQKWIYVKEDRWDNEGAPRNYQGSQAGSHGASEVIERSMFFESGPMSAQSSVRCISSAEATANEEAMSARGDRRRLHGCCKSVTRACCVADGTYIAEGFHLTALTALPLRLAAANAEKRNDALLSVLVIGLGGGALPTFLRHAFPDLRIDVAEKDAAVVATAKEWFGLCLDDNLKIHVEGGLEYLQRQLTEGRSRDHVKATYDIIFLDAFVGSELAPSLANKEAFGLIRRSLSPGGVLAANLYSNSTPYIKEVQGWMESVFQEFSFYVHLPLQISLVGLAVNMADLRQVATCCGPRMLQKVASKMGSALPNAVVDLIKCKSFVKDWEAGARNGPVARAQTIKLETKSGRMNLLRRHAQ